eukprot:5388969-Amphidinium_carterae.1
MEAVGPAKASGWCSQFASNRCALESGTERLGIGSFFMHVLTTSPAAIAPKSRGSRLTPGLMTHDSQDTFFVMQLGDERKKQMERLVRLFESKAEPGDVGIIIGAT